jgi:hypothetical protein
MAVNRTRRLWPDSLDYRAVHIRSIIILIGGGLSAVGCGDASNQVEQSQAVQYFFSKCGATGTAYFLTAEYASIDDDARQLRDMYRSCASDDCYVAAWTRQDTYNLKLVERFCEPSTGEGLGRLVVLLNESSIAQETPECVSVTTESVN